MTHELTCVDCETVVAYADVTAGQVGAVGVYDSHRISFSSWEVGASVTLRCPSCASEEADQ